MVWTYAAVSHWLTFCPKCFKTTVIEPSCADSVFSVSPKLRVNKLIIKNLQPFADLLTLLPWKKIGHRDSYFASDQSNILKAILFNTCTYILQEKTYLKIAKVAN